MQNEKKNKKTNNKILLYRTLMQKHNTECAQEKKLCHNTHCWTPTVNHNTTDKSRWKDVGGKRTCDGERLFTTAYALVGGVLHIERTHQI